MTVNVGLLCKLRSVLPLGPIDRPAMVMLVPGSTSLCRGARKMHARQRLLLQYTNGLLLHMPAAGCCERSWLSWCHQWLPAGWIAILWSFKD